MAAILTGLIIFSLAGLVSIPMFRLWFAPAEKIREGDSGPALAPH